jgi:hypothetical protein
MAICILRAARDSAEICACRVHRSLGRSRLQTPCQPLQQKFSTNFFGLNSPLLPKTYEKGGRRRRTRFQRADGSLDLAAIAADAQHGGSGAASSSDGWTSEYLCTIPHDIGANNDTKCMSFFAADLSDGPVKASKTLWQKLHGKLPHTLR